MTVHYLEIVSNDVGDLFAKGIVTRIGRDRSAGAVSRDAMPAKADQ